jgi:predicted Zn-dependent peptidase
VSGDNFYQSTRLNNGLTVISERVPGVRSISLGLWIKAGSRDENRRQAGITHFLEHLVFKGTTTRSARDIAEEFDDIGGELNAFSAKEYTCLYARILDHHLDTAINVLSDLATNPVFRPADIESERAVVLEEVNMHEDAPAELVHDLFDQRLFAGHPLGRRVIGTEKAIRSMTRDDISAYFNNGYTAPNIVVAAAGNVLHNKLVRQIEGALGDRDGAVNNRRARRPMVAPDTFVQPRDTQQAHICFGFEGMSVRDDDRFVLSLVDTVLGGGMSSRLFQNIREKRGLVYAVYSFRSQYAETGSMAVYAGTSADKATIVCRLISEEFDRVSSKGITGKELARAKEQLKGSLVIGLEDITTRMSRLGRGLMCGAEILSADDLIARIDGISASDVKRVAAKVLAGPRVLTVIGPVEDAAFAGFTG